MSFNKDSNDNNLNEPIKISDINMIYAPDMNNVQGPQIIYAEPSSNFGNTPQIINTEPTYNPSTQPMYVQTINGVPVIVQGNSMMQPTIVQSIPQPVIPQEVVVQDISTIHFGRSPVVITCPNCKANGPTTIEYEVGPILCIWTILLFCFVCMISIILLCIPSLQVPYIYIYISVHKCRNCGRIVGKGNECE